MDEKAELVTTDMEKVKDSATALPQHSLPARLPTGLNPDGPTSAMEDHPPFPPEGLPLVTPGGPPGSPNLGSTTGSEALAGVGALGPQHSPGAWRRVSAQGPQKASGPRQESAPGVRHRVRGSAGIRTWSPPQGAGPR
nr:collagen alpha-1(I) chain-like [Anser cygnoides]